MRQWFLWCCSIASLLAGAVPSVAAVFEVPSAPTPTIASALDLAQNGDVIEVAAGTYYESHLIMRRGVTLVGVAGAAQTVIDAQGDVRVFGLASGSSLGIEGFTVTGASHVGIDIGYADPPANAPQSNPDHDSFDRAGGPPTYTIRNCVITGNGTLSGGAGGIYQFSEVQLVVESSSITNNLAGSGGGYFQEIFGFATFEDCLIQGNRASGTGGGVGTAEANDFTMRNCTIRDNVGHVGGGVFVAAPNDASIQDCQFIDNVAASGGGGLWASGAEIDGCVFVGNCAGTSGGGIYWAGSKPIERCTFAQNEAPVGGGIFSATSSAITSCIVAYSTLGSGLACASGVNPLVKCCDIFGNAGGDGICGSDGGGNFSLDPQFCDLAGDDVSLRPTSPCLQQNYPTSLPCQGTIGAREIGCQFPTDVDAGVEGLSWGRMKSLYR